MTITPATLYWITRLDGINDFLGAVAFVGALVAIIFIIVTIYFLTDNGIPEKDEEDEGWDLIKRAWRWIISVIMVAAVAGIFTPSSKEMAMIYVVPHIAESQVIKQDMPEVYDLGIKALKDWLKKENEGAESNGKKE